MAKAACRKPKPPASSLRPRAPSPKLVFCIGLRPEAFSCISLRPVALLASSLYLNA